MKLWLARGHDGKYSLTALRPVWSKVRGADYNDFYERTGEPVGIRHLCANGMRSAGHVLAIGEMIRVEMTLKALK